MKIRYKKYVIEINNFTSYESIYESFYNKYPELEKEGINLNDLLFSALYAEKMIWTTSVLEKDVNLYDINFAMDFTEGFSMPEFKVALHNVIRRNDILRSSFHFIEGELYRKINEKVELSITTENFPAGHDLDEILRTIVDSEHQIYDLSMPPLFKVKVLEEKRNRAVVYFNFHHIIFDGPSVEVFVNQLMGAYDSIRKGKNVNKDEEADFKNYRSYINRENDLNTEYFEENDLFWKNQLSSCDKYLPLPKEDETYNGFEAEQIDQIIPDYLTAQIKKFCKENGVSPFILFIGVYSILLNKYTGKEEMLIGIPVTTRETKEIRKQIGCFINIMVLKINLWGEPTIKEVLYRVKNALFSVMERHNYPTSRLYEILKLERNTNEKPLFQVALSYQSSPFQRYALSDGAKVKVIDMPSKNSLYDVYLEIVSYSQNYIIKMLYNKKAFGKAFILRMGDHLLKIIETALSDINQSIDEMEYITKKERDYIKNELNEDLLEFPYKNFYLLFQEQCKKKPDDIALKYLGKEMSYTQLLKTVDNLANILWQNGVKKGDIVALLIKRNPELVASLFAVQKLGVAYLPIEISQPVKRIRYYIDNANAEYILTDCEVAEEVICGKKVIDLRNQVNTMQKTGDMLVCGNKEDLAYICYTSGSTGKPKGIMISNENLNTFYNGIIQTIEVEKYSNWLFSSSIAFDTHVLETFVPLLSGKTVSIATDECTYDMKLLKKIIAGGVDFIHITPTKLEMLLEAPGETFLNNVKVIVSGAEPLTKKVVQMLRKNFHGEIYNIYGPTEAAVYCCINKNIGVDKRITLGRPIKGYNIYILDENDDVVPIGIPGQICISGKAISKGYKNLSELTSEVFVEGAFHGNFDMYRTGDIGKWNEEGEIVFLGRKDNQVKIKGNRVELDEIEINIEKLPYVKQAKVVYKDDKIGGMALVAYVKLDIEILRKNEMEDVPISKIKEDLMGFLPGFMIPSYIVKLQRFPTTVSGKIDYNSFPPIDLNTRMTDYIEPTSQLEKMIHEIFAKILHIKKIGVLDNFFSLGGESMKAIQVVTELISLGFIIDIKEFFQNPTIQNLAQKIVKTDKMDGEIGGNESQKQILNQIERGIFDDR